MTVDIFGKINHIVIETDTENPVPLATITDDGVDVAEGYRVRVNPVKMD